MWIVLAAFLPWGAGDWLASFPVSRGRGAWEAGVVLLQRDSPPTWDKMVRLYRTCGDQRTEACEAALYAAGAGAGGNNGAVRRTTAFPAFAAQPRWQARAVI